MNMYNLQRAPICCLLKIPITLIEKLYLALQQKKRRQCSSRWQHKHGIRFNLNVKQSQWIDEVQRDLNKKKKLYPSEKAL